MITKEFLTQCYACLSDLRQNELPKIQGAYEKVMANCAFMVTAIQLAETEARLQDAPQATHEDFKEKPPQKEIPDSSKIMEKLTETQNASTVEALKTPIEQKAAIPADWATRTLKMEEIDSTWTDKLLQNKEYQELYKQLANFLIAGAMHKAFTEEWLNSSLSKFTGGKINTFVQPKSMGMEDIRTALNQIPPNSAKFILSTMKQAYAELKTGANVA